MNSQRKVWVALDCSPDRAVEVVQTTTGHPAVRGYKLNRTLDQAVYDPSLITRIFGACSDEEEWPWWDLKLKDVPRTVAGRVSAHVEGGFARFITMMADGGIDMMMDAVEAGEDRISMIAVTELTSLSEEDVHLGSGKPAKGSVLFLARHAVLAGVKHLVCSGKEVPLLAKRRELKSLNFKVPAVEPKFKRAESDQMRVVSIADVFGAVADPSRVELVQGSAIVNSDDPRGSLDKIAEEIEAIEPKAA